MNASRCFCNVFSCRPSVCCYNGNRNHPKGVPQIISIMNNERIPVNTMNARSNDGMESIFPLCSVALVTVCGGRERGERCESALARGGVCVGSPTIS